MLLMKIFCLTLMISQQRKYFNLRQRRTKGIAGRKFGLAVSERKYTLKTTFYRGLKLMVNNSSISIVVSVAGMKSICKETTVKNI